MWSPIDSSNVEDYNLLAQETDINKNGFNTGIMLYNSSIIKDDTVKNLFYLTEKYQKINAPSLFFLVLKINKNTFWIKEYGQIQIILLTLKIWNQ